MSVLLDRLYNLHWVTEGAARAAQPYLGFYRVFLKAHGFKSLINLRGENAGYGWWRREKAAAEGLGIVHFDVRMSSRNLPSRAALSQLFDAFERAPLPLLMKCSGGQDRTGLASALYLLRAEGPAALPRAEAQFAFWPYLHRPKTFQTWLRHFPAFAAEQSGGDLAGWARETYTPEHFAVWLEKRGLARSYGAIQVEAPDLAG